MQAPSLLRRRRSARGFRMTDRATVAVGAAAVITSVAAVAIEVRRVWQRAAPPAGEWDQLADAARSTAEETVETVVAGYRGGSSSENALFNMLASFVTALVLARGVAYGLRSRRTIGPFRDLRLGRRRVHHFVPGIAMAFGAGAIAIGTRDPRWEPWLAVPFGAGMGMTLDESALLLELDDVYWTEEGVVGMQISLAVAALLAALAIALRFVRRGERIVQTAPGH